MKILKVVCIKKESLDKDVFYPSDFGTQDLYIVGNRLYIEPPENKTQAELKDSVD